MFDLFRGLPLVMAAALLGGQEAGGSYSPGWSAVHADASNSDYLPIEGASRLRLRWSRRFDGLINLGPTSDGQGRLYLTTGGAGCRFHALDRATGATIWCSEAPDRFAVASSPLIDREGVTYLADGQAMRAFDRTGAVLWRTPINGVPLSAQFTAQGDLVFITHIGVVYLLRREDGLPVAQPHALSPEIKFDPAQGARACMRGDAACPSANTPALDIRTGRLFFTYWAPGAAQAGVRALRLIENPVQWVEEWRNDALPGGSGSSPTLSADGSRLYLTDNAGALHALDAATGVPIWGLHIGYAARGSPSVSPEGLILPAGGADAPLLAVADQGARGEIVWRRDDLANRGIVTQAAGGFAYATIARDRGQADLAVIDARSGRVLDRDALSGRPLLTVGTTLDLDGTVYVPAIVGTLDAFSPSQD